MTDQLPIRRFVFSVCAFAVASIGLGTAGQPAAPTAVAVDKVFSRWTDITPGCAVGAAVRGETIVAKAYGMANLEHDVKNTPDTIFEAGSVSKQFTAAAVLLLARDGKLSLDDPVRKYLPEVPDYGVPLTIRHMLNHTSGLRDWGSVAGIGGWPRTSRAYTHAHVLDIVSRQSALNFTPGTRYSYSNSGYNLAAILVARLSGMSFAEFSQKRLFGPLKMTHTSWRDDHRRIVKGRAIAYADDDGQFRIQMPFENVHGNGGLLTTVGDLLKWNQNFTTHVVGDAAFVAEQERAGRFNDGREHGYALGLMVGSRRGVREVAHSGSTAGYRAHLNRYPEHGVSVAVLCNVSSGAATQYANAVADLLLADRARPPAPRVATHTLSAAEIGALAGMYRDTNTGEAFNVVAADDSVRVERGAALIPQSATRLHTAAGAVWDFDGRGSVRITDGYGTVDRAERVSPARPTDAQLQELVGAYASEDAETIFTVAVEQNALVLKRRPDTTIRLTPTYADAFTGSAGTVRFRRQNGRVVEFSLVQDRVWDLRFKRQPDVPSRSSP
jgi:CubicO group peptidase (beta-lactamase class C family)